jgi:hypothetical protein
MNRALLRLNDHSIDNPLKEGPAGGANSPGDENQHIREAMNELLWDGSASSKHFNGDALAPENSSLLAWVSDINASLRSIGIYVNEFEVTDFALGQHGIGKVNYSFDMKLGLKDYTNTSTVSRSYHIANELDVSGLVDPALARTTKNKAGDAKTVYRMFFFNDAYPDYSHASVKRLGQAVSAGQGWIYGPLALASGSAIGLPDARDIAPSARGDYILVGAFDDITALQPAVYGEFAGYIVTTAPTYPSELGSAKPGATSSCGDGTERDTFDPLRYLVVKNDCVVDVDYSAGASSLGKPFIIAPKFDPKSAPDCPLLSDQTSNGKCVLMLNRYLVDEVAGDAEKKLATKSSKASGIYDVEPLRDFTMCGYYTHNAKAPSYLQHLLDDSYSRKDAELGIETFVIGNYANDHDVYDTHARLDRELFDSTIKQDDITRIRGMPGCRDFSSCADEPKTGIFAISDSTRDAYNLNGIACDNGAAGCGG